MEAFSLLKYWKGSNGTPAAPTPPSPAAEDTTAILAATPQNDVETTDDEDDNEDGPFFDLEFTVPDEEPNEDSEDVHENPNDDDDNNNNEDEPEREFNFTLSPSTINDDRSDPDLFFKGKLVQLENDSSEPNSKPQFTASLLKSATKFRVFMLGLKKSKPNVVASDKDSNSSDSAAQKPNQQGSEPQQKKLFTVKFKVEEVPIVSLFTRDNSSKGGTANKSSQKQKQQNAEESELQLQSHSSASDEKQRFSKEVMQKYLKKVKPLYVRVSRRYAEKLRFSGQLNMPPPPQKPAAAKAAAEKAQTEADTSENGGSKVKGEKQGNLPLPAGLRVVCKHLGKSRSASSSVASPTAESVTSRRRDDSLVQQHDGIQSAILHCKKSFNASRECESSHLPRPASNPLHELLCPESSSKSTNDVEDEGL